MRVAIHQPNFLPWPGYFAKMAQADRFVLLDDAQFSRNNIINRVRILGPGAPRWLTVAVGGHLGDPIDAVQPVDPGWAGRALSLLRNTYGRAAHFRETWPALEAWLLEVPAADLAAINVHLIARLATHLDIGTPLLRARGLGIEGRSDDRLVAIVASLAPGGTYLSGRGGSGYQDPAKFAAAGLDLAYYAFSAPEYDQGVAPFQPGLSVIDALFHVGRCSTIRMVRGC
jgi:hypothetical protein